MEGHRQHHGGPDGRREAGPYTILSLLGTHPEELEASLCACYAPRNPIAEFWRGEITLRHLRALVEGLPQDTALARAERGPWGDPEWIAWHVEARLSELLSLISGIVSGNPGDPDYLPTPDPTSSQLAAREQQAAQERADAEQRRMAAEQLETNLIPRRE